MILPPQQIELLSPCGDYERLELALKYGADAVYLGANSFGMRATAKNFSVEELQKSTELAHSIGKKVYLTCNIFPHNSQLKLLPDFIAKSRDAGVDAFIIADLGIMKQAQRIAPNVDIHISTQAGIINYETARIYYEMGAKRIVPARELSLEEIAEIRAKTDKELEIECFIHGAMCMSVSGRCLLSSFMIGRDANLGMCAQPCRWEFEVTDITRPTVHYPVEQDNGGTYFMNSRDMCMIEHIPELVKAGIDSFKIEGRAKSAYYTAVVTNAYRHAIDGFIANPTLDYQPDKWVVDELEKVSHREYSTGFYYEHPDKCANIDYNGGYIKTWDVAGFVEKCENGILTLAQRNKFNLGETLEIIEPNATPVKFKVENLQDEDMNKIDTANHACMKVKILTDKVFQSGSLVRREIV